MNGAGRPRQAPATDDPLSADGNTAVTQAEVAELLAGIRRELEDALADGEDADPYWAIVAAALAGAITWTQAQRAIKAIEEPICGECQFCGSGLVELADAPKPAFVCIGCGRLWPFRVDYRLPEWRVREILGKNGPDKAS